MAYTLIGSPTSPYVRRLRLYLRDVPYTFEAVNIMEGTSDARLSRLNPIKRIPVLLIDDRPLWESRPIFNYLQKALERPAPSLPEENLLSAVDALQDQLVQTFLLKRHDHAVDPNNWYYRRAAEREKLVLSHLAGAVVKGELARWEYPAMSLYCLLDWAIFRSTLREPLLPALTAFHQQHAGEKLVAATDPRLA